MATAIYPEKLSTREDTPVPEGTATMEDINGKSLLGEAQVFVYDDSRKLGVTGSIFLTLNKMVGTGSKLSLKNLK